MMTVVARFLRRPKVIVAEIALLAAVFAFSTLLPAGDGPGAPTDPAGDGGVSGAWLAGTLGLDHLFTSPLFLVLVGLAASSLSVVLVDQVARAWKLSRRGGAAGPGGAPYRREAILPGAPPPSFPSTDLRVRGSAGAWGSPLFHLGVLLVILAGILGALFGADAVVDLMAGEALPPRSDGYGRQWQGLLARPFAFPDTVQLEELRVSRYPSGETRSVEGTLRVGEGPGAILRPIAVNSPVRAGSHSLYLRAIGGAAVLVETGTGAAAERHALLLREAPGRAEGTVRLRDGTLLRAVTNGGGIGRVPERVDLRVLRDGALVAVGQPGPGESLTLPDGTRIAVVAIVPWAQFSARRDFATPLVYIGFLFACAGGFLMMSVVRVERGRTVESAPGGTRLTAWMRPQRFAPLFGPAFDAWWEEQLSALEAARKEEPDAGS